MLERSELSQTWAARFCCRITVHGDRNNLPTPVSSARRFPTRRRCLINFEAIVDSRGNARLEAANVRSIRGRQDGDKGVCEQVLWYAQTS